MQFEMPLCGMSDCPGILISMNACEFEITYKYYWPRRISFYEFNTKLKDSDTALVCKYQNTPTLACSHQCFQVSQMEYEAVLNWNCKISLIMCSNMHVNPIYLRVVGLIPHQRWLCQPQNCRHLDTCQKLMWDGEVNKHPLFPKGTSTLRDLLTFP